MDKILKVIDSDLGDLFHQLCDDYKYSNGKWYYYNGSVWVHDDKTIRLKHDICVKLGECIIQTHTDERSKREAHEKIIRPYFQGLIAETMRYNFKDDNFYGLIDSKAHLIPFTNGVYDLLQKRFRPIEKDDCIMTTLGYDYNEEADVTMVEEFLDDIFQDVNVKKYFLKQLSNCLCSSKSNELVHILKGGLSVSRLVSETFGNLYSERDIKLVIKKTKSGLSSIAELKNKRVLHFSKTCQDKLEQALLKDLIKDTKTKIFITCDTVPEINGHDSIWRRIRVVNFKNDSDLENEPDIQSLKQGLMKLLVKYYFDTDLDTLVPDSVKTIVI